MKILVQTLLVGALAATAVTVPSAMAADTDKAVEPSKKPKKITDRRHPDYVRCRSEPIIGSLARKRRICMTNAEWVEYVEPARGILASLSRICSPEKIPATDLRLGRLVDKLGINIHCDILAVGNRLRPSDNHFDFRSV